MAGAAYSRFYVDMPNFCFELRLQNLLFDEFCDCFNMH